MGRDARGEPEHETTPARGAGDHLQGPARRPASSSRPSARSSLEWYHNMQNEKGAIVDLYIPRKCSWTNQVIAAKDHASVQISIGCLDENGVFNGKTNTIALAGYVRVKGESDMAVNELVKKF